jgi:hypothetical protein
MNRQDNPQPQNMPSAIDSFRKKVPYPHLKTLLLTVAIMSAVAATPPLAGNATSWSPAPPSGLALGPHAVTFQRQVAPAVAGPMAGQLPDGGGSIARLPGSRGEWTIEVAGSGGQEMVDACIGPVHYTPTDDFSLFITEHDYCGGWARFSGIEVGQTVTLPGYGTYTVDARGQVPLGGTTSHVSAAFDGFPRAVLQTCIPGTNQILVIALN